MSLRRCNFVMVGILAVLVIATLVGRSVMADEPAAPPHIMFLIDTGATMNPVKTIVAERLSMKIKELLAGNAEYNRLQVGSVVAVEVFVTDKDKKKSEQRFAYTVGQPDPNFNEIKNVGRAGWWPDTESDLNLVVARYSLETPDAICVILSNSTNAPTHPEQDAKVLIVKLPRIEENAGNTVERNQVDPVIDDAMRRLKGDDYLALRRGVRWSATPAKGWMMAQRSAKGTNVTFQFNFSVINDTGTDLPLVSVSIKSVMMYGGSKGVNSGHLLTVNPILGLSSGQTDSKLFTITIDDVSPSITGMVVELFATMPSVPFPMFPKMQLLAFGVTAAPPAPPPKITNDVVATTPPPSPPLKVTNDVVVTTPPPVSLPKVTNDVVVTTPPPPPILPVARFSIPKTVKAGADVRIVNESENAQSFSWNFGDRKVPKSESQIPPVFCYQRAGEYTVTLTAYLEQNFSGQEASVTHKVRVTEARSVFPFILVLVIIGAAGATIWIWRIRSLPQMKVSCKRNDEAVGAPVVARGKLSLANAFGCGKNVTVYVVRDSESGDQLIQFICTEDLEIDCVTTGDTIALKANVKTESLRMGQYRVATSGDTRDGYEIMEPDEV